MKLFTALRARFMREGSEKVRIAVTSGGLHKVILCSLIPELNCHERCTPEQVYIVNTQKKGYPSLEVTLIAVITR